MKKQLAFIASFTILCFHLSMAQLALKAPIPEKDYKMEAISGKKMSLQDAKTDKGLLVIFTSNTCPYVIGYQSRINAICELAQAEKLGVILVNPNEATRTSADAPAAMKAYAEKNAFKWDYAIDENHRLADAFQATRTPECFLFNKDGILVYHGGIDDNPGDAGKVNNNYLKAAITEMLSGKNITKAETKSVGCTIKRVTQ